MDNTLQVTWTDNNCEMAKLESESRIAWAIGQRRLASW
jgi:hypothetical protein